VPSHKEKCKEDTVVGVYCNGRGKKIKLHEEAIGEILVAYSGSVASDIDDYFEKEERGSTTPQTTTTTCLSINQNRLQQVADYQAVDCLKVGTQIFTYSSSKRCGK
jgi:hypothetical protein